MESIALDMEDIFDEQANEDDFPSIGPLPDLPGEDDEIGGTQAREDEETNAEVLSRLKDLSKGAAKQVVRRPQPKLDAARLTGDRGIPVLPKVFQDVKFKGKGQEAHDLQIIMRYLEHWAHRLFPKMPFDEVLERIERLGTKNEVKTCIKKMRLDMPVLSDDFVQRSDDEAEDIPNMNGDNVAVNPDDNDAEEAWDEMIREEEERNKTGQGTNTSQLATQLSLPLSQTPSTPTGHLQNGTSPSKVLTPEQIERMERNKLQALARRAERNSNTFKTPAIPKSPGRRVVSHGSSPQSKGSHGISGVCTSTHSQHTSSSCSLQSSSPGELTSQGSTQANATERSQPTFLSLLTSNNTGPEGDEEFSEVIPMMGLPVAATTQALGGHHFSNHVDSKINGDINECRSSVDQNRLPDLQDSNMSEVFPIVQGVPNQNCNTFNPSSGPSEHDSVSSPKKLKTDLNVSSGSFDQVSEDDLRLHLSESD